MRAAGAAGGWRVRVLVVDDEALARSRATRMLARIDGVSVVGEAESGSQALERMAALTPDVLMLDVEMPGIDGLQLAETARAPWVIFTTAHPEFAAAAFDLDAVDYLIKPLRQERLERAIERVRSRHRIAAPPAGGDADTRIAVHAPDRVRFVDALTVDAFRALDKYTAFQVGAEQLLIRDSLDSLEARLAPAGFVRVHRAALVRRAAITDLRHGAGTLRAELADGSSVEVSRRCAPELHRELGIRRSSHAAR